MTKVLGVLPVVLFMLFALTKTQENVDENCGQYNDCSSCITKHQCQYVSWESKERIIPDVKKCVDITLSESEVQQLGPLGNDKNDTHWEMKSFHDEMKCHIHHAKKALSHVKNIAKGALSKSILKTDKKSSDDSVDPTILSTTVMPLEISSTPNSDEGSSTSKPLDVRQSNPSNLNTQGFINREKPGSLDMDEGKHNNQNISQEIEKNFGKSNDILTKKADLIQNGACNESSFDIGSFIGGMVLAIVLSVICVFGVRYYKMRGSRNYNYLLWGESNA